MPAKGFFILLLLFCWSVPAAARHQGRSRRPGENVNFFKKPSPPPDFVIVQYHAFPPERGLSASKRRVHLNRPNGVTFCSKCSLVGNCIHSLI